MFCAWLAWSRFRVVLPVWDRTLPSLLACLDTTLRTIGGAPTYALTDNEKTVTVEHIARVPVRHPDVVVAGRHYGMTIRTCMPADPQTKGGSEATVRIAKADLVPTEANLREAYSSFAELEAACAAFGERVNQRPHRATGRAPVEMLAEEASRLHVLPAAAVTSAFGETRRVGWDATISVGGVRYSVPHQLVDSRVWTRMTGDEPWSPSSTPTPGPARSPATRADGAAAHRSATSTTPTRIPRSAPSPVTASPRCERGGGGVPGHRARRGRVAARGRRHRHRPDADEDGRGRVAGQAAQPGRGRPGPRRRRPGRALRRGRPADDPRAPTPPTTHGASRTRLRDSQPAGGTRAWATFGIAPSSSASARPEVSS